jgi:Peptidase C13 family
MLGSLALFLVLQSDPSTHVVVITGLGGEPAYRKELAGWGGTLAAVAHNAGVPLPNIMYLAGDSNPGSTRATRDRVLATLQDVTRRSRPNDIVLIFLAGHGSHEGADSRINLPGPDLTAGDLATALEPLKDRRVVVINAASASGDFVPVLSQNGRVVITATRSPFERNIARFGGFFVVGMSGAGADVDKDGRVSVLEAFLYARRETGRLYESDNRLLTEHAVLDDNGDKQGSAAPGAEGADGGLARTIFLGAAPARLAITDSAGVRLQQEARALETRINELRGRRGSMKQDEYEAQLEALLVDLALANEALRARRSP